VSKKKRQYILTLTAESDFRQARKWSQKRWGKALTKQYFEDLHQSAEYLAENQYAAADASTNHAELANNFSLRVHPVREHYMVYLPMVEHFIIIVALIRQTRDVPAILRSNRYLIERELKEINTALTHGRITDLKKH
jgi:plasmid stabilization system protein ParE